MTLENIKLPDFYLSGFSKCGTTTLGAWLSQSPDICRPKEKEPRIFSFDDKENDKSIYEDFST
jgi:hypothetical protein